MANESETQGGIILDLDGESWQNLKNGSQRWVARKWDITDDRLYQLGQIDPHPGMPGWVPKIKEVTFNNNETGECLRVEYKGRELPSWGLGWGFLLLGDVVDTEHGVGPEDLPW